MKKAIANIPLNICIYYPESVCYDLHESVVSHAKILPLTSFVSFIKLSICLK